MEHRFVPVAKVHEIPEGQGRSFVVAGRVIAVFCYQGRYYALDNRCPHAGGSLAAGSIVEQTVVCPRHAWRFCLTDGSWADYPKLAIQTYPVRVEGKQLLVGIPELSSSEPDPDGVQE